MKKLKQKKLLGLLGIATGVVVISISAVIWAFWYDLNVGFGAPKHPDFKGYTTTAQLNGGSQDSAELIRYKQYGLDAWWFEYVLHYSPDLTVSEKTSNYLDTAASCKYRPNGTDGDYYRTCNVYDIKNGGRYVVATDSYKGELFGLTVEALIGTTEFYVAIPKEKLAEFAAYGGWQTYFDSMQPVNLETMQFDLKTHHQGGG